MDKNFSDYFDNAIKKTYDDCNTKKEEQNNKVELNLSAPWIRYVLLLKIMFESPNPDKIHVVYDDDANKKVKIYVDDFNVAFALMSLLPEKKEFGNVTLTIEVIPANLTDKNRAALFTDLFGSHPYVKEIVTITPDGVTPFTYICFDEAVVEYWNDNLGNPHGLSFALYQDIAEEIFGDHEGIWFTTASE